MNANTRFKKCEKLNCPAFNREKALSFCDLRCAEKNFDDCWDERTVSCTECQKEMPVKCIYKLEFMMLENEVLR